MTKKWGATSGPEIANGKVWIGMTAEMTSNVILLLSSVSIVGAVWTSFLSPQESWHLYAGSYGKLRRLESDIGYALAQGGIKDSDCYFGQYQTILKEHNEAWANIREKAKNP